MSNLQPNCCLKFDFQKVDQHAGGKWLIHDTKRRKDNQLQSLKRTLRGDIWIPKKDVASMDGRCCAECHKQTGEGYVIDQVLPNMFSYLASIQFQPTGLNIGVVPLTWLTANRWNAGSRCNSSTTQFGRISRPSQ